MQNVTQATDHWKRIANFMAKAKHPGPSKVTLPNHDTRYLRAVLILEEARETLEALGFRLPANKHDLVPVEPNLVKIVDGCADVSVVTIGTLVACGVPDAALLEMVDNNNLAKFAPGHYYNSDGKLCKPAGHKPPDIAGLLAEIALQQERTTNGSET